MEEEDEEDIYFPEEPTADERRAGIQAHDEPTKDEIMNDNHEDAEEEDVEIDEDESDSDIDIITERKDGTKPDPPAHLPRIGVLRTGPARGSSPRASPKPEPSPVLKTEPSRKTPTPVSRPGSSYPPVKTSKIDLDAKPIYEPTGKPITEIDMDADFPEDDKPWRKPGTDMTDFFNYGFDEFTWASYCLKQETLRKEVVDQKKQMEDMQNFLAMPGGAAGGGAMPSMPGMPNAAVPGMPDMPPELQQMMQQMMASGMDPSQMDFNSFSQMMAGAGQAAMGGQAYGQQAQQQQQQQQQMGYGYGAGGGGGGGQGGNRGQGGARGHNRRW